MLLTTLKTLWLKVRGWALVAGAILVGLFSVHRSGKQAGRRDVENEMRERDDRARRQAAKVADKVDRLDPDAIDDEFDRLHKARRRR